MQKDAWKIVILVCFFVIALSIIAMTKDDRVEDDGVLSMGLVIIVIAILLIIAELIERVAEKRKSQFCKKPGSMMAKRKAG